MLTIFRLKLVLTCSFATVCAVGVAQTRLSYPDVNPPSMNQECLKNPTMPGCAEAMQMLNSASPMGNPGQADGSIPDRASRKTTSEQGGDAQPVPAAKEEPTEFQRFVAASVGRELPLFGYGLFEQVPTTFAPVDRIPVTAEYVIGPGDELLIRAWGQIDLDARVTVDRNGAVYLPRVGSLAVAGVQYRQLADFLKSNIGRMFRNFDLTVSLGQLRSIQVFIVGQARRPGVYTVSSLSTLVNTLFASGGPSNRGSMRHIQLKRNGQKVIEFDLYDLLLNGDKSKDVVLQPGDVIYIPPVGPQVALSGSVNTPAIYELASGTDLKTEIEVAGGLTNVADGERVIVERIEDRTVRQVDEFKLDAQGLSRPLRDGDLVRVFSINPRFKNAVTLRGNVAQPGRYPWHEGMRVRDLIPNREFLLTRNFWEQQNLTAGGQKFGATQHEKNQDIRDSQSQTVLKNDVKRNAPEINWDYAVIQRLDPVSLSTNLVSFNLGQAIVDNNDVENKVLQPGDIVTIFSQADIPVSVEKQSKFVRLEGEFKSPGVYKVGPGETLQQLIARAGGLTPNAYIFGAEFTRDSVQRDQQRTLDGMVRELEMEMQRKITAAQGRSEQQSNVIAELQTDQKFIDRLRSVTPTGRIVLEWKPTHASVADIPDLSLEDGDRFVVPNIPSTVTVMGAVYTQSSFVFQKHAPVKKYLALAGNSTRMADAKHMFLLRADGTVVSRDQASSPWGGGFESIQALPGDLLVVPTQLDRGAFMRGLKDWTQVIANFGLGAAAIYVLTGH